MATLDELEAEYQASIGPTEITIGLSDKPKAPSMLDELESDYQSRLPTDAPINNAASQAGKGLTFGYFDELMGLDAAAQDKVASLFGRGSGRDFWDIYEEAKTAREIEDAKFSEQNPKTAFALNMAGAAAPALIGGAVGLGAKGASTLAGKTAQTLYGVGIDKPLTVAQLAKMGAIGGAITGSGEAAEDERLSGAAVGGALGAVIAPVAGKAIEKGTKAIGNKIAEWDLFNTPVGLEGQRGSISSAPSSRGYTPEQLMLARELKETPIEKIIAGADEMQSVDDLVPLFLPEALDSKSIYDNAAMVANTRGGKDFAQDAIKNRTAGAQERASYILDDISDERSIYEGGQKIAGGARKIVDDAINARQLEADPLYAEAYKEMPLINSPHYDDLLANDKVLQAVIRNVKKTANNAEFPDNSTQLLVKARSEIGNLIESAKAKGKGREARDLTDTYNRLNNILHRESKGLADADTFYQGASREIDDLNSTFLSNLGAMTGDKVKNVGQIFQLSPERITQLKGTFDAAGKSEEWNAGVRAHLQRVIESTSEGKDFTRKIIGNTLQDDKLKAALGDYYEPVAKGLGYESRMFEAKNKYTGGSPTAWRQADQKSFKEGVGVVKKILDRDFVGAIETIFQGDIPEEVTRGLAKIYFDPKSGKEAINKILPLLQAYDRNGRLGALLGTATDQATSRSLADSLSPGNPRQQQSGSASSRLGTEGSQGSSKSEVSQSRSSSPKNSTKQTSSQDDKLANKISLNEPDEIDLAMNAIYGSADPEIALGGINIEDLVRAVVSKESNGNQSALSPKGARGRMQLMPETAKELGVDPYDPIENIIGGTKYLVQNFKADEGDDALALMLARYNAGPGAVKQYGNSIPPFAETQDYVEKILAMLEGSPAKKGKSQNDFSSNAVADGGSSFS